METQRFAGIVMNDRVMDGSPSPVAGLSPAASVTGAEIAGFDWSRTELGPTARWPLALVSLLRTMLACPTPMFLAWGPELRCFYNDAYRPILGYRLATALGAPFAEVWASIWDDIKPLVEATLAGGQRVQTDMRLDLARTGVPEESYWSFTYSPAFDDEGRIAGLFCVTGETTAAVVARRERDAADERLQLALSAGNSIGTWDWDVVNDRITADARFAILYGVDPAKAAAGAPIAEFFGGIHPEDLPRVQAAIGVAMRTGGTFAEEYRLLSGDGELRWVSAQGRCLTDEAGSCVRFPGVSYDVTDRRLADLALVQAKQERDFVIELTARQRELADPDAVMRLSAEALAGRLGANRTGFYRIVSGDRVRYLACWSDGTLPLVGGERRSPIAEPRLEELRRTGVPLVYADSRHDPEGGLDHLADLGVLAGISIPIFKDGRAQAGLYVNHATVRHWTASEVALAKEVAELAWLAVERAEGLIRIQAVVARQGETLARQTGELRTEAAGREVAESQVRQLQKMEAVGQLTGGIAHDFNNMLAVVIGGLNMLQRRLDRGETDVGRYVEAAMDGATRAAGLTQRLLAFSRQQPLSPSAIDLNRMVAGLTDLLARTLGEAVQLEAVLAAGLWRAKADQNQLENALINLAVNARDAMPDGGRLTIETANAHVDRDFARDYEIAIGQYVMIAVSDTGTGMTREVLSKAFDPFFTTKGVGKGTGLGLSQVYGFVRQSGGHVRVYSEPGHGTAFKIYLPRFWGDEAPVPVRRGGEAARRGDPGEIVLVVEDEARVRALSVDALRELGYTVIHASNGPDALGMIEAGQDVTLLFTDVVMPEMTGRQLADAALARLPRLKVLYTTGYTRNAVVHNGVLDPGTNFLAKPFGLEDLAAKVREAIDGG